jgi:hypothetical protein
MSPGTQVRPDCLTNGPTSPSGIQLAFLPLSAQGPAADRMLYYAAGIGWQRDRPATTLFTTCYYWTSISAGRLPGTNKWILLYQLSGPREVPASHGLPIVARIADTPWDLATAPEVPVFDPAADNAWGHYMATGSDLSFAYGAYLLHKYTQWDPTHRTVTIFYLLSTGLPYQVQLMRTVIAL